MIEHLDTLSLEQKIGQLFFIGISGSVVDESTLELLDDISPGGVCLFARNIRDAEQTRDLLDAIRDSAAVPPFLAVDQEGGLVDRLRRIMEPMPAASKLRSASEASILAAIIAESLLILGFNMNFAPVVDVTNEERSKHPNGLSSRTFGTSKEDATEFARSFIETIQAKGVVGCLKHFPGLGAARVDSHEELPRVDVTESEFVETDLFPYRELIEPHSAYAVMIAHAAYPEHNLQEIGQDGKLIPSSLSHNFISRLLRRELRFEGVVITDDLEMGAILKNYGIGEACKMAIGAGVDMLAICADPEAIREGFQAVMNAAEAGDISLERIEESLARIADAKSRLVRPLPFDQLRLEQLSNDIRELNRRLN